MNPEIAKRRTFAIISHPDAGKTTLTEKFLLYGGALQLAGAVNSKRQERGTTSDWMELEKKRGISVSSTVLQFDYNDFSVNLLDTPGHEDFSEDTYRVLTAVDAAIMVVDAAKGIETQTRKLFEVCRMRGIPIFAFINKCDRPGRNPLELMDEIESVLEVQTYPINWPLGMGMNFTGVYARSENKAYLYQKFKKGKQALENAGDLTDSFLVETMGEDLIAQVREELEMIELAGAEFSLDKVRQGEQIPVFFGSALNNFGIRLLLDGFLKLAPPPRPRKSETGIIRPEKEEFSGFVFKIQANMDPHHRDRIAFIRVCSGHFSRDMNVWHKQLNKKIRLSFSHKMFGRERETQNEAWAGDIIGITGHSELGIGDTLTEDQEIVYNEIPRFPPECFAYIINEDTQNYKRFRAGLEQLLQEKVIQSFSVPGAASKQSLLGAVGPLQFDVVKYRLETEYRAPSRLESAPYTICRWIHNEVSDDTLSAIYLGGMKVVEDDEGNRVLLFDDEFTYRHFTGKYTDIELSMYPKSYTPEKAVVD